MLGVGKVVWFATFRLLRLTGATLGGLGAEPPRSVLALLAVLSGASGIPAE